jgi:predicted transposase/invertase (TIGR01784 family)
MATKSTPTSHDLFFKYSLRDLDIAKDYFKTKLPAFIKSKVNLETLKLQPDSFIESDAETRFADILYEVSFEGEPAYIYLLAEHQSKPDRLMPLRLWNYLCKIWMRDVERSQKSKGDIKLPYIIPIVFYHGKQKVYPYSMDFEDYFEDKAVFRKLYHAPFNLVNVSDQTDEELATHGCAAILEIIQKRIFEKELISHLKPILELDILKEIDSLDLASK